MRHWILDLSAPRNPGQQWGIQPEEAARESICPGAAHWPGLSSPLGFSPREEASVKEWGGRGWTLSHPGSPFAWLCWDREEHHLLRKTQHFHAHVLDKDLESHEVTAGLIPLGKGDRLWNQTEGRKKTRSLKNLPCKDRRNCGRKAAGIIYCPVPKRARKWLVRK